MKAKEYYEKYKADLTSTDPETRRTAVFTLWREMHAEVKELAKARGVKRTDAYAAVIAEENLKWNSIAATLREKDGVSVLQRNGFENIYFTRCPKDGIWIGNKVIARKVLFNAVKAR